MDQGFVLDAGPGLDAAARVLLCHAPGRNLVVGPSHLLDAGPKLSFFDCGGIRLMLDIPEQAQFQHPPSILYYKVGDIAAVHRELQDKGVRFEDEPHVIAKLPTHDLWMTFARDSEDNIFALMSEVTQR